MKLISVYEHDTIRIGQKIKDREGKQELELTQQHIDALTEFNQRHKKKFFRPVHRGIKFIQYVGTFQIDDVRITVHPKVSTEANEEQWCRVLPHMLKHTQQVKIHSFDQVMAKPEEFDLIELYFENFLTELELLITRGLVKRYRKQESNQPCLKGKLLFSQHIRHNLVHQERFYTAHTVYDPQHRIHQVFAEALEVVRRHSRSQPYRTRVRRTQERMPELPRLRAIAAVLESIKLDRKTAHYRECFNLAKLIILNLSPGLSEGQTQVLGFMFDMNRLWEQYILNCLLQAQASGESVNGIVIKSVEGYNSKSFWGNHSLRPDIVMTYGREDAKPKECTKMIIDTKWKSLATKSTNIQDVRQMFVYQHYFDAKRSLLLYPESSEQSDGNALEAYDFQRYQSPDQESESQHALAAGELALFEHDQLLSPKETGARLFENILTSTQVIHIPELARNRSGN